MPYKDPEKRREAKRRHRATPLGKAQRARERANEDPEKCREYTKKYRLANPEKVKQSNKKWRLANPEKAKQHRRRENLKLLGWTPEMMVQTLREQGDRCAICRLPMNPPCADHRHVTPPEPRGALCNGCNAGIGMLKENPEICRAAAEYLEAWS